MIVIGIDTGVSTGVSIWCQKKRIIEFFEAMPIHRAMSLVQLRSDEIALVRVEDARKAYKPKKYLTEEDEAKKSGAASVKRDAKIWEDMLTDLQIPFELVKPNGKHTYKATKKDPSKMNLFHKLFPSLPRFTTVGEDHIRDATALCYGLQSGYTNAFQDMF